jgi:hypothetical protein
MPQRVQKLGDPEHPTWLVEDPTAIENTVLSFFLEYWRRTRRAGLVPLKGSFVPQEVRGHLQWVTSADALPGNSDFRYRVVGSRICDYFLGSGRAKTIREAYASADKAFVDGVLSLYRHACETGLPIRVTGPASRYRNIFFPSYESLYLPYATSGEHADHVVCIFWYNQRQLADRMSSEERLVAGSP